MVSTGLVRNSVTPSEKACLRTARSFSVVTMMMGMSAMPRILRKMLRNSLPDRLGIR